MRSALLFTVPLLFLAHGAMAETQALNISESDPVLLPQVASIAPQTLSRTDLLETTSKPLNLSLGNHFSTELEGSAISVLNGRSGTNLPSGGSLSATSLMLRGLYEISNGSWHMKPYVGGGFGYIDANSHVLGQTTAQWQPAYQVHSGIELGFTEKLFGSVEYRWTMGSKPGFYVAGIPAKLDINQHGFTIGFDYKY